MVIEETKKITKLSHSTMHSTCIDILDCQNFGINQNGDANFFVNEIYPQKLLIIRGGKTKV
jgi:hypothetical protein